MISKLRFSIFASVLMVPLGGCMSSNNTPPAAATSRAPGATGQAVVPGNNSTVSGDKPGTSDTKTGQTSTGASGGGSGK